RSAGRCGSERVPGCRGDRQGRGRLAGQTAGDLLGELQRPAPSPDVPDDGGWDGGGRVYTDRAGRTVNGRHGFRALGVSAGALERLPLRLRRTAAVRTAAPRTAV